MTEEEGCLRQSVSGNNCMRVVWPWLTSHPVRYCLLWSWLSETWLISGVSAPQWPEHTGGLVSVGVGDGRIYQELLSPAMVSTVSEERMGHSSTL